MRYELKKLNPRIVDCAIALIQGHKYHYTCLALQAAASAIHKKGYWVGRQYSNLHREVHSAEVYKHVAGVSTWWNSARACKASRVKALEELKARIIEENTK